MRSLASGAAAGYWICGVVGGRNGVIGVKRSWLGGPAAALLVAALVAVQALVSPQAFATSQRTTYGAERSRVQAQADNGHLDDGGASHVLSISNSSVTRGAVRGRDPSGPAAPGSP